MLLNKLVHKHYKKMRKKIQNSKYSIVVPRIYPVYVNLIKIILRDECEWECEIMLKIVL